MVDRGCGSHTPAIGHSFFEVTIYERCGVITKNSSQTALRSRAYTYDAGGGRYGVSLVMAALTGTVVGYKGNPTKLGTAEGDNGLISKAKRSPLHLLILESCNLGKGRKDEAWTKVARRVYANDDFSYPRASD